MGRRTQESIGRPLPGRETWVLSRDVTEAGVGEGFHRISNLETLRQRAAQDTRPVWICGGAQIYTLLLPECSDLYLTRVFGNPAGDTWFPEFETRFRQLAVVLQTQEFVVEHWRNMSFNTGATADTGR